MKILVIGSGGREHALVQQIAKSDLVAKIYCAPGNPGMDDLAECVAIPVQNTDMLLDFAIKNKIDLTVVGPEQPLVNGLVDAFEQKNLKVFGPRQEASILEGSKTFTKEFCKKYKIPTADFAVFTDATEAKDYLNEHCKYPIVIKADGLAAGKGVVIAENQKQAHAAIQDMMLYEKFGASGRRIVIEQFLKGEEASYIVVADGTDYVSFTSSQDHKAAHDGDTGPNTGGMGAYAPAPLVDAALEKKIKSQIIEPTLAGMQAEGKSYLGFLYAGVMVVDGEPMLLEYNCRLGDPEAQVILPLLKSDLVALMLACLSHELPNYKMSFDKRTAVGVVMANKGYPGAYEKGAVIEGLNKEFSGDVAVVHSGTKRVEGKIVAYGGRVLTVCAIDKNLSSAIDHVYQEIKKITWSGAFYRKDIGQKGLKHLKKG